MQGIPQNKTIPDTGKGVWQSPRVKSQNISCFSMRWQQIELGMKRNVLKKYKFRYKSKKRESIFMLKQKNNNNKIPHFIIQMTSWLAHVGWVPL